MMYQAQASNPQISPNFGLFKERRFMTEMMELSCSPHGVNRYGDHSLSFRIEKLYEIGLGACRWTIVHQWSRGVH